MQALISGITGTALLVDGEHISTLQVDDPDSVIQSTPGEVRQFLSRAHDAYAVENVQVDHVREQLEAAWEATAIFSLTQILLGSGESDTTRALAAEELDESLQDALATELAERRLFSAQLPSNYRQPESGSARVSTFVERLVALQPAVNRVETAYSTISSSRFESDDDNVRDGFLATSIREGLFREIVLCAAGEQNKANVHFKLAASPSLKSFRGHRNIVTDWLSNLDVVEERVDRNWIKDVAPDQVEDTTERSRGRQSFNRTQEHERVLAKQDQIEKLLREGKVDWATENAANLVQEQIEKSGPEFACQTLSSLAKRAQEIGLFGLQLTWAKQAHQLNDRDPVAATQVAHALLKNGDPREALVAYDDVIDRHPENVFAKTGRAETLRSLGAHDQALQAYDDVISQHPENVVAKSGRAETLRSLGEYDQALQAYDDVISQHPENVFAKTGRAETLRSLGAHDQALQAYDDVIIQHPENVVAKTGRAETLRSLGAHDQALQAYDDVISQHPENVVAKNGRAETLRSLGAHDQALQAYDDVISQHPENVFAKTGRVETLRSLGAHDQALQAYDDVISQHPENVVAKTGRAETLRSLGEYDQALQAYDEVIDRHPENVVAKTGRAETLRSLGEYDQALQAYDEVIDRHPENVVAKTGRAETLRSLGEYDQALQAYDDVIDRHPEDVVAKNGRAETLRSLGEYDQALQAYDDVISQHPENVVAKNGRAETLRSLGEYDQALQAYDDVISQHPEDVVAKNGRAETLRSLGEYDQALQAYDDVISQHPENVVAKTGRISTLVSAFRFSDALECVAALDANLTSPQSKDDWIAFHIRAMIYVKTGKLADAEGDLRYGVETCRIAKQREYFVSALAIVQMKLEKKQDAKRTIEKDTSNALTSQLIRGLVFYENDDASAASTVMSNLAPTGTEQTEEIQRQMTMKYVDKVEHAKPTDWFLDQLTDLLIAA